MAAVCYMLLNHRYGNSVLDWQTKYYLSAVPADAAAMATSLAQAEAPLVSTQVAVTGYELRRTADNVYLASGEITPVPGTDTGELLPIRYAVLLRAPSAGVKRSSHRFIHGVTEFATAGGVVNSQYVTKVSTYSTTLQNLGVTDSDGTGATSWAFRSFTMRRRMRRRTE